MILISVESQRKGFFRPIFIYVICFVIFTIVFLNKVVEDTGLDLHYVLICIYLYEETR